MMEAHWAGLFVKLEDIAQGHVSAITVPDGRGAGLAVGGHVCRCIDDGPVDMTRDVIELVHLLISRSLRVRGKKKREVGTCRHRDGADLLGIKAAFCGLAAHKTHGSLAVFPGSLVDRKAFRTRCAVHKIHALNTLGSESLIPLFDEPHIAAAHITTSRDEYHTAAVWIRRSVVPFEVSHPVVIGAEALRGHFRGHRSNLMSLPVRHLALRPYILPFNRRRTELQAAKKQKSKKTSHLLAALSSASLTIPTQTRLMTRDIAVPVVSISWSITSAPPSTVNAVKKGKDQLSSPLIM